MALPKFHATGAEDRFAIYVRDHLAASAGGLALLRRSLGNNLGTDYEPPIRHVLEETRQDRDDLERVAAHNGVTPSRVKHLAATLAEKAGRAKLNGEVRGYSPLARLWELELLGVAVAAKTALWILLAEEWMSDRVPTDVDAGVALARGRSQVEVLEQHRRRAAVEAFAHVGA